MAVDATALSLLDLAMISNSPLVREVSMSMINAGAIFEDLPVFYKKTMTQNGLRVLDNLPTIDWVPVNTEATVVKGKPTPYQEQLYIFRNAVHVDHLIEEEENSVENPTDFQIKLVLKALTYDLNNKLINNNHTSGDVDSVVGFRARLDNTSVYGTNSACKIDCASVDMRQANMTAATWNTFMAYLDNLLDEMDATNGDGITLYVNDVLGRCINFGARQFSGSGGFTIDKDQLGRKVLMYNNAKFKRCGRTAPSVGGAQTTQVITSTESTAGADSNSVYTSLYAANYGKDTLFGWSYAPTRPFPTYTDDTGIVRRSVIEGTLGLKMPYTRALGRLFNVKVA